MRKQIWLIVILIILTNSFLFSSTDSLHQNGISPKYNGMKITRIEFSGLKRTKENVVRAVMNIKEGDIYNEKEVKECLQKINNLNIFSSVVFYAEEEDKQNIVLIINVTDPWTLIPFAFPQYNSNIGIDIAGGFMDSNFLGYGNSMSLVGDFNYSFKKSSIDSFGIQSSYNLSFPDNNSFSYPISGSIARDSTVDYSVNNKDEIIFSNQYLDIIFSGGISYKLLNNLYIGTILNVNYINNNISINTENKEKPKNEYYFYPDFHIALNNLNYSEGGSLINGTFISFANMFYFNFESNFFMSDLIQLDTKWGMLWLNNYLNYVGQFRYIYFINNYTYFGGDGWIRGFSYKEIQGNNALILNNEFRFKLFNWNKIGKVALAAILDSGYITNNFDFLGAKLYTGLGPGIRFYPAFLGGVKLRLDVAFNTADFTRFPEIIFDFDEMY